MALRKQEVLTNAAAVYIERKTTQYGSLLPADVDGFTEPPAGSPCPLIALNSVDLVYFTMAVNWVAGTATLSVIKTERPAAFNQVCPGYVSCIPQPRE